MKPWGRSKDRVLLQTYPASCRTCAIKSISPMCAIAFCFHKDATQPKVLAPSKRHGAIKNGEPPMIVQVKRYASFVAVGCHSGTNILPTRPSAGVSIASLVQIVECENTASMGQEVLTWKGGTEDLRSPKVGCQVNAADV